jgi:hypothetical protein
MDGSQYFEKSGKFHAQEAGGGHLEREREMDHQIVACTGHHYVKLCK